MGDTLEAGPGTVLRIDRDWPHIGRILGITAGHSPGYQYQRWAETSAGLKPAEMAAAYDEWAEYFEHSLAQRAHELTANPNLRRLDERWTDSMAYSCRRLAAWHRGEDPGEAIPQRERRPDLFADRACTTAPPLAKSA